MVFRRWRGLPILMPGDPLNSDKFNIEGRLINNPHRARCSVFAKDKNNGVVKVWSSKVWHWNKKWFLKNESKNWIHSSCCLFKWYGQPQRSRQWLKLRSTMNTWKPKINSPTKHIEEPKEDRQKQRLPSQTVYRAKMRNLPYPNTQIWPKAFQNSPVPSSKLSLLNVEKRGPTVTHFSPLWKPN